jgi:signal transduction histidine kinase
MENVVQSIIQSCAWDVPKFVVFSDNVFGTLVYYSHFIALVPAVFFALLLIQNNRRSLANILLFLMLLCFGAWIYFDLILWATDRPEFSMFFWAAVVFIEPLIYALAVYLLDVFVNREDVSFKKKLGLFIPLVPIIVLLPTNFVLLGFDLTNCDRAIVEGFISNYYVYTVELLYVFWLLFFSFRAYRRSGNVQRKQILIITSGLVFFLLSFASGNIVGSMTENWSLAQAGIIGMPIFLGFLTFAVVRFGALNIKIISTQVLVFTLAFLIGSLVFVVQEALSIWISVITFLLAVFFGAILIRSVKHEIKLREQLQSLANDLRFTNRSLEQANTRLKELDVQKTEFVSFATHQLRSPLTAMKGYSSLILEGDYGKISESLRGAVEKISESANTLTTVVNDYLNITRIELGGMQYVMKIHDMKGIVKEVISDLAPSIAKAGVKLKLNIDENSKYLVTVDIGKMKQVVGNIIDNALKYSAQGNVTVTLSKDTQKHTIELEVKDDGIGMSPEIIPQLFSKFRRADNASKANIRGTGLGLYVAKQLITAMHGNISAESEGEGKGSRFLMELPAEKNAYIIDR